MPLRPTPTDQPGAQGTPAKGSAVYAGQGSGHGAGTGGNQRRNSRLPERGQVTRVPEDGDDADADDDDIGVAARVAGVVRRDGQGDLTRALDKAVRQNARYRERHREDGAYIEKLEATVNAIPDGGLVLNADDAKAWDTMQAALKAHNLKPEDVATVAAERDRFKGDDERRTHEIVIRAAGRALGYRNLDAFVEYVNEKNASGKVLRFELREEKRNGKPVKVPYVRTGDKDTDVSVLDDDKAGTLWGKWESAFLTVPPRAERSQGHSPESDEDDESTEDPSEATPNDDEIDTLARMFGTGNTNGGTGGLGLGNMGNTGSTGHATPRARVRDVPVPANLRAYPAQRPSASGRDRAQPDMIDDYIGSKYYDPRPTPKDPRG